MKAISSTSENPYWLPHSIKPARKSAADPYVIAFSTVSVSATEWIMKVRVSLISIGWPGSL